MYEDLGYEEKLLGILMIASHLKRTDWDMWVKTGNLAVKLKDYRVAIHCISKGVLVSPSTLACVVDRVSERAVLYSPKQVFSRFT